MGTGRYIWNSNIFEDLRVELSLSVSRTQIVHQDGCPGSSYMMEPGHLNILLVYIQSPTQQLLRPVTQQFHRQIYSKKSDTSSPMINNEDAFGSNCGAWTSQYSPFLTTSLKEDIKTSSIQRANNEAALRKYEEAVLVKEVFCRGRFLLVKLAYPNYSTLLSDRMHTNGSWEE